MPQCLVNQHVGMPIPGSTVSRRPLRFKRPFFGKIYTQSALFFPVYKSIHLPEQIEALDTGKSNEWTGIDNNHTRPPLGASFASSCRNSSRLIRIAGTR